MKKIILQSTGRYYVCQLDGFVTTDLNHAKAKIFTDENVLHSVMSGLPRCYGDHLYEVVDLSKVLELVNDYLGDANCWPSLWIITEDVTKAETHLFVKLATAKAEAEYPEIEELIESENSYSPDRNRAEGFEWNCMYQFHHFIFRTCNVAKRFSHFSFYELPTFESANMGDCSKNNIIKIDGNYYIFSEEKTFTTSSRDLQKSKIIFKQGRNIMAEFAA